MPYKNGKVVSYNQPFNPRAGTLNQPLNPDNPRPPAAPKKSPRPKARPAAPMKSMRPKARPKK